MPGIAEGNPYKEEEEEKLEIFPIRLPVVSSNIKCKKCGATFENDVTIGFVCSNLECPLFTRITCGSLTM